jgi:Peptidase family M28
MVPVPHDKENTQMINLTDSSGVPDVARDMRYMCETIGRRLAGSEGEEQTADYCAGRFEELGLVNIEKLPFACKAWEPGHAELAVIGGADTRAIAAQQVTHSPVTPAGGVEGDLVFFEPVDWEKGLRCDDLAGKIGLFVGGYGESAAVFEELHNSALEALIFVDTRMQTDWPIANGVGERFMGLIRKPMAYVSLMDAWALARDKAQRVRLTCSGTAKDATSWNVAGELPGDPDGNVIVVCGHLDSVSVGVGADDNASGMAAILECARRLKDKERRHTLRFIGFGAEEQLSVGSHRYVKSQVKDLDNIAFVCNFDSMGAHLGLSTVMCTGTPEMDAYIEGIVDERQQYGVIVSDVCPYQDQFWFTVNGIPGLWFSRQTHIQGYWYHHSEHNNLEAMSFEQIAWGAETACEILDELASSANWPFERAITSELAAEVEDYVKELF